MLVLGEFKRGKTTLIGTLTGQPDVLPVSNEPCTAVVTTVCQLREGTPKATVFFRDGLCLEDLKAIDRYIQVPDYVIEHMKKKTNVAGPIPPLTIQLNKLNTIVAKQEEPVDDLLSTTEVSFRFSFKKLIDHWSSIPTIAVPYKNVEVAIDSEFLREENLVLIDSPGLHENEYMSKITQEYIPKADAILFVLSAAQFLSLTEKNAIKELLEIYHYPSMIFAVTHFDDVRDPEKTRSYVENNLKRCTSLSPAIGIHCIGMPFQKPAIGIDHLKDGIRTFCRTHAWPQKLYPFICRLAADLVHVVNQFRQQAAVTEKNRSAVAFVATSQGTTIKELKSELTASVEKCKEILREITKEGGPLCIGLETKLTSMGNLFRKFFAEVLEIENDGPDAPGMFSTAQTRKDYAQYVTELVKLEWRIELAKYLNTDVSKLLKETIDKASEELQSINSRLEAAYKNIASKVAEPAAEAMSLNSNVCWESPDFQVYLPKVENLSRIASFVAYTDNWPIFSFFFYSIIKGGKKALLDDLEHHLKKEWSPEKIRIYRMKILTDMYQQVEYDVEIAYQFMNRQLTQLEWHLAYLQNRAGESAAEFEKQANKATQSLKEVEQLCAELNKLRQEVEKILGVEL